MNTNTLKLSLILLLVVAKAIATPIPPQNSDKQSNKEVVRESLKLQCKGKTILFSAYLGLSNIISYFKPSTLECDFQMKDMPLKISADDKHKLEIIVKEKYKPDPGPDPKPERVNSPTHKIVFTLSFNSVYITGKDKDWDRTTIRILGDENLRVKIRESTFNVGQMFIRANIVEMRHSWFMYKYFDVQGQRRIFSQKSEFATSANKCNYQTMENFFGSYFPLDKIDCKSEDLMDIYSEEIDYYNF